MAVSDELAEVRRHAEREVDVLRDHMVAKLRVTADKLDHTLELYRNERETSEMHHNALHELQSKNLEEFKQSVREQISQIMKTLEVVREDRGQFVTRDVHDTHLDTVEKAQNVLEKSLNEKVDLALEQTNEKLSAKITQISDRLTKMEQGISVMNARNQQSIIALGILLTAVEILIRFFTS